MESILLDTMFDLPSLEGVEEVVISKEVVEGTARPLYIYADRSDRTAECRQRQRLIWPPGIARTLVDSVAGTWLCCARSGRFTRKSGVTCRR